MERETVEIKTPKDGKAIILKAWLSAREKRSISSIFSDKATFDGEKNFKVDASVLNELQDAQIKNVVVSIGGKTENILDLCLDMKLEDFDFILAEVEKIVNPEITKKK